MQTPLFVLKYFITYSLKLYFRTSRHRRDIKPENILLTSRTDDINLKLADFGFAVKSGVPAAKQQAGTPGYIAPEILLGKAHGEGRHFLAQPQLHST